MDGHVPVAVGSASRGGGFGPLRHQGRHGRRRQQAHRPRLHQPERRSRRRGAPREPSDQESPHFFVVAPDGSGTSYRPVPHAMLTAGCTQRFAPSKRAKTRHVVAAHRQPPSAETGLPHPRRFYSPEYAEGGLLRSPHPASRIIPVLRTQNFLGRDTPLRGAPRRPRPGCGCAGPLVGSVRLLARQSLRLGGGGRAPGLRAVLAAVVLVSHPSRWPSSCGWVPR